MMTFLTTSMAVAAFLALPATPLQAAPDELFSSPTKAQAFPGEGGNFRDPDIINPSRPLTEIKIPGVLSPDGVRVGDKMPEKLFRSGDVVPSAYLKSLPPVSGQQSYVMVDETVYRVDERDMRVNRIWVLNTLPTP